MFGLFGSERLGAIGHFLQCVLAVDGTRIRFLSTANCFLLLLLRLDYSTTEYYCNTMYSLVNLVLLFLSRHLYTFDLFPIRCVNCG